MAGKSDPFQIIKERFPADKDRMHQLDPREEIPTATKKGVNVIIGVIFNVLIGNTLGLLGVTISSLFGY